MKGGTPVVRSRGILPPENFEISSPRKLDFRHSEAKSVCFNISFKINYVNLYLIFLQVFDDSCFNLGGFDQTPQPP